jgi:hypothetical protein
MKVNATRTEGTRFHTGHAYLAFDSMIRRLESGIKTYSCSVPGYSENIVRERLIQRVVEIGLWPYIAICASRLSRGLSAEPECERFLDFNGIIIDQLTNQLKISLRKKLQFLAEFFVHWAHLMGAIVIGCVKLWQKDSRASTLVFGIGVESLIYQNSDKRFACYCREGPISSLKDASRLIVQNPLNNFTQSDQNIIHARFPINALIIRTKLGILNRARLLASHIVAPIYFFFAVIKSPNLLLLARDFAYFPTIKRLDELRKIEAVLITNSFYATQPLWMRNTPQRHFLVHMVFYSQNIVPHAYVDDGLVSDMPYYRHTRVDVIWVWTNGFKEYLRSLGLHCDINAVGPILWYMPVQYATHSTSDEVRIVIYDLTPVKDDVSFGIRLITNYYETQNLIRFVFEIVEVCEDLSKKTGVKIRLQLKHKRGHIATHDARYLDSIRQLHDSGRIAELVSPQESLYALSIASDLSIVIPFSSPAYVADYVGRPSIYFDPIATLCPNFEKGDQVRFASGREQLRGIIDEILVQTGRTGCRSDG